MRALNGGGVGRGGAYSAGADGPLSSAPVTEAERIQAEYARRARDVPKGYYSLSRPDNLFLHQTREREMLRLLGRLGFLPLNDRRILEVGCGLGRRLVDFERWGANRGNLAGIDLVEASVDVTRSRLPAWRDEDGELRAHG